MFCTASCEHDPLRGQIISYTQPRIATQQNLMQTSQQQPQQQCNMCHAALQTPESCNEPELELEPPRVGMCLVTERPEGLSIDCNVPLPNSFNIDAYKPPVAYPTNANCFTMPMPQSECSCNSNFVSGPAKCACFDSALPENSLRSIRLEQPRAPTQQLQQQQQQCPCHLIPMQTPSAALLLPEQGAYFYGMLQILPQQQQPHLPAFSQLQGFSLVPMQQPKPSPEFLQQAPTQLFRFDFPCQMTECRSNYCCHREPQQPPLTLQLSVPSAATEPSACAETPAYCAAAPPSATATPTASCMNRSKDSWNTNPAGALTPPQHCLGNVCMKCSNCWHCPRCSNCFWHPDKINVFNQRR